MLHEVYDRYVGSDVSARVVIASDSEFEKVRMFAKDLLPTTIRAGELARLQDEKNIKCLELRGEFSEHISLLAEVISRQAELRYIAFQRHHVDVLVHCSLPRVLQTIQVTGEGAVHLPSRFFHENVARVIAFPALFHFERESLPGIRHFHLQFDKQGKIRKLLDGYADLVSLTLCPTKSVEDFVVLPKALRYLRLIDGSLRSLTGIDLLSDITNLHLQNLPHLADVGDIAKCKNLKEVSIGYCNRIANLESFAEAPSLERFKLYGSKVAQKDVVRNTFGALSLRELVLNI